MWILTLIQAQAAPRGNALCIRLRRQLPVGCRDNQGGNNGGQNIGEGHGIQHAVQPEKYGQDKREADAENDLAYH